MSYIKYQHSYKQPFSRHTYFIPFTPTLSKLSAKVHEEMYHLLKLRNPDAELFVEEPELMKLYLSYILIRDNVLDFEELDDDPKNMIRVEIRMDPAVPLPTPLDPCRAEGKTESIKMVHKWLIKISEKMCGLAAKLNMDVQMEGASNKKL